MDTRMGLALGLTCLVVVGGCTGRAGDFGIAATDGFDSDDVGSPDPTPTDPEPGPDPEPDPVDPEPPLLCPAGGFFHEEVLSIEGATYGAYPDFEASCAPADGNDFELVWTVPYTGNFVITATGRHGFDPVLSAHYGTCEMDEFACDHDTGNDPEPRLVVSLTEATVVTIVVDGFAGEDGEFILEVEPLDGPPPPLTCALTELGVVSDTIWEVDNEVDNEGASLCAATTQPDQVAAFTAAESGYYRFVTGPLDEDDIHLDLRQEDCSVLSCDTSTSAIGVQLDAMETAHVGATFTNESFESAEIQIVLEQPHVPGPTCPQHSFDGHLPETLVGYASVGTQASEGACGTADTNASGSFVWRAPTWGIVTFRATMGLEVSSLTVREATCDGPILACAAPTATASTVELTMPVEYATNYIIDVSGMSPDDGTITLEVVD